MFGLYAIVLSGGKQVRVEQEQVVKLEKLPGEPGTAIELDRVLLVGGDGVETRIGQPFVAEARVKGTIVSQGRTRKVLVFRYKAKKNIRKRRGHRQPFTRVRIDEIQVS